MDWVVSETLIWIKEDGTAHDIKVRLGKPLREGDGEWSCLAVIDPDNEPRRVHGVSALQAHALALRLVQKHLEHLAAHGRLLYSDDDQEVSLTAVFGAPRAMAPH